MNKNILDYRSEKIGSRKVVTYHLSATDDKVIGSHIRVATIKEASQIPYMKEPHAHTYYLMGLVSNGEVTIKHNEKTHMLSAGFLTLNSPDYIQEVHCSKDADGFLIAFSSAFFGYIAEDDVKEKIMSAFSKNLILNLSSEPKLYKMVQYKMLCIWTDYSQLENASWVERPVSALIYNLISCVAHTPLFQNGLLQDTQQYDKVYAEFSCLLDNMRDWRKCKVSDFATQLGVSVRLLQKSTSKHAGKPPKKIIDEKRLAWILQRLFHSRLAISEIAFVAGFEDVSNFSNYFHTKKGCSPSDFRKKYNIDVDDET